ncbi:MAG: hypothetical protein LBI18_08395 [Planctomycetaceae bacterium]|nr:hypothetical protein [Planctomycetaceae bacterium]
MDTKDVHNFSEYFTISRISDASPYNFFATWNVEQSKQSFTDGFSSMVATVESAIGFRTVWQHQFPSKHRVL